MANDKRDKRSSLLSPHTFHTAPISSGAAQDNLCVSRSPEDISIQSFQELEVFAIQCAELAGITVDELLTRVARRNGVTLAP